MTSDLRERAERLEGEDDKLWDEDFKTALIAEFAAIRAEAESIPVKRLYDALSAMMYGWEDDGTRLEAFAALKEAEPFIASVKPQREG